MRSLLLGLVYLATIGGCSEVEGDPSSPVGPSAPDIGIAFPPSVDAGDRAFSISRLRALCVEHVRLSQQWAFREPERGRFVWRPLDDRLGDYEEAGVDVLLTLELKGLPDWFGLLSEAEQEAEFREYVRALLDRSAGTLSGVQFGNEWNWEVDRYFGGDTDAFVRLATVLSEETARLPESVRPRLVLGSLSIGGLHGLAFAQGRIDNVYFDETALYSEAEIREAAARADEALARYRLVFGRTPFEVVDLHLYDDVWNWPEYRAAVEQLLREVGRSPDSVGFVASEFGGPHPDLESGGESFAAERVREYVRTLGAMDIERAYFFKLVEEPGSDVAHPNSYLISAGGEETRAFDMLAEVSCP